MASVVLTGDTSGQVTLSAPAIAGTNTITLPAATGTAELIGVGTAVASTSGTAIDFTSIPSWAKRITVVFNEVSTSGSSVILVQIGAGTTPETTGYISTSVGGGATNSTTGYCIRNTAAASSVSGLMTLVGIGSGIWISSHATKVAVSDAPTGGGSKTITGTLGVVRITTTNGTDTFDAGSINILYEG